MQKTPLANVRERFKDKQGLISAVEKLMTDKLWVDRINADKGLKSVSNRSLLRLHDLLSSVKSDFGSRDKLIDAITELKGRPKDADFKASLVSQSTPRLVELHAAAKKGTKRSSATTAKKAAPKKAAPRKAAAPKKAAAAPRSAASLKAKLKTPAKKK